jgi:hypothetical protein
VQELYIQAHGEILAESPQQDMGTWRKTRHNFMQHTGTFSKTITGSLTTAGSQVSLRLRSVKRQIPDVRNMFANSPSKADLFSGELEPEPEPARLFGRELVEIMKEQLTAFPELQIPHLIHECIQYILRDGLTTEGIFRISASSAELERIVKQFNSNPALSFCSQVIDVHSACCLLKQFLRELPTPVIPYCLQPVVQSLDLSVAIDDPAFLEFIKAEIICSPKLHPCHFHLLENIVQLCAVVAAHATHNRMDASNLAVVFGPNMQPPMLLTDTTDRNELLAMLARGVNPQAHINHLLHALIKNAEFFFPSSRTNTSIAESSSGAP